MKTILTLTTIAAAVVTFGVVANAKTQSRPGDFIALTKDGGKFYNKVCTVDGSYCGNWNVR